MGSIHQRMMLMGCVLLGVAACAGGDSRADSAASAPAVGLGTSVSTSAPLAGFGAGVPAGTIPGSQGAPRNAAAAPTTGSQGASGTGPAGIAAASASTAGTNSPATNPPAGDTQPTPLTAGEISAATGVFTVAQANRGRDVYANRCAQCHVASQHAGGRFAATWNTRRVFDLYDLLHNTMPLDDPGSLAPQEYVDVVAYMLQLNGHPAGTRALEPDPAALRKLRIDIRSGVVP